jgi:hypothetical protein
MAGKDLAMNDLSVNADAGKNASSPAKQTPKTSPATLRAKIAAAQNEGAQRTPNDGR